MVNFKDMQTRSLSVKIADSLEQMPKYKSSNTTLLKAHTALILPGGTNEGLPSVDLQLIDADGNEYVVMATGKILEGLGSVIKGVKERDNGES